MFEMILVEVLFVRRNANVGDKFAARRAGWRFLSARSMVMIGVALIGAWPDGWLGRGQRRLLKSSSA